MLEIFKPHSRSRVIGFDTFEAEFPNAREYEMEMAVQHSRNFDANAYDMIRDTVRRFGLKHRIELVKGDIAETLPRYLKKNPGLRVCLVHCDLDIYEPTLETLKNVWPRVVSGGLMVFDEYGEYHWGESDAVDDFLAMLPAAPKLRILEFNPSPTAYLVKGQQSEG